MILPAGDYSFRVDKCQKDTMSDGSEVLAVELVTTDQDGKEHRIYDVISTQEKLDEFLVSIGKPPGAMKLKTARKASV